MLSERMFSTIPETKIAAPIRNRGSSSHSTPYSPVYDGFERVEDDSGAHDHERNPAPGSARAQRIDERPVQVMALPHDEKYKRYRGPGRLAREMDRRKHRCCRQFHDDPAEPVVDVRPPTAAAVVAAVRCSDAEQVNEGGDRERDDRPDQGAVNLYLGQWHSPTLTGIGHRNFGTGRARITSLSSGSGCLQANGRAKRRLASRQSIRVATVS